MKKLFILGIALSLFISCAKEDNAGIPPVNQGQTPQQKDLSILEASTAKASDYVNGKKVKIHGNIVRDGNRSYFKFSDNTMVLIYAATSVYDALPQEKKTKLSTAGQEITVTGTLKDFTPKNSTSAVKQIVYESESDLVFGAVSNNPQPQQPTDVLEAATATANDYVAGKDVKIHGTIVRDGNHSYFKFSDNTMVQIYVVKSVFDLLSQEDKTKFATTGQEVTVTGKFKDFKPKNSTNVIKEIECTSKDNLVFGATPNNPQPQPQPQPQPSQGGVFDFEWITDNSTGYGTAVQKTIDGVSLEAIGRTNTTEGNIDYAINGKGLVLNGYDKGHIKITFPNGVKNFSFDYKAFHTNTKAREIVIREGNTEIDKVSVAKDAQGTYTKALNKTGQVEITIKGGATSKQFVIDNIKWTN